MAKKISQTDLRRLMSQKKNDILQVVKKVDSPLARYKDGQLWCIVCDTIVRSDAIWVIHINSKKHKENITRKKQPVVPPEPVQKEPRGLKRPNLDVNSTLPPPPKQTKSILKNPLIPKKPPDDPKISSSLPDDFFDSNSKPKPVVIPPPVNGTHLDSHSMEVDVPSTSTGFTETNESELPEGFFDDPKLDAKARNIEYKDPVEEEWERFQKELKEESTVSAQIMADDQEDAVTDRQIGEIDEQLNHWNRVLALEVKKEKLVKEELAPRLNNKMHQEDDEEDEDEEDFDEFLNWRAKKSFR